MQSPAGSLRFCNATFHAASSQRILKPPPASLRSEPNPFVDYLIDSQSPADSQPSTWNTPCETRVLCNNLDLAIDDDILRLLFKSYGQIQEARVIRAENRESRGFGIILFKSANQALAAVTARDGVRFGIRNKALMIRLEGKPLLEEKYKSNHPEENFQDRWNLAQPSRSWMVLQLLSDELGAPRNDPRGFPSPFPLALVDGGPFDPQPGNHTTLVSPFGSLLVYQKLFSHICFVAQPWLSGTILKDTFPTMFANDDISAILKSRDSRKTFLQLATHLGILEDGRLRSTLREYEKHLAQSIVRILQSESQRSAVLALEDESAQIFLDVLQDIVDKGLLKKGYNTKALRMIVKLSQACDKFPSSMYISGGVSGRDDHALFGGGFGDIYQASYAGKRVALKRIRTFHRDTEQHHIRRRQFCREALVWQHLKHPFILPLIGIDRETFPGSLCMVSPWMENGTILRYLHANGRANVNKLLLQVAQALQYLHSQNVVHGDLRGANILVTNECTACLADFGLSFFLDTTVATWTSHYRAGSIRWMAPELIDPDRFGLRFLRTPASDVYAFACVCLELYTGRPPFSSLSDPAAMLKVIEGVRPHLKSIQPPIPRALWDLLDECWAHDPTHRLVCEDVVELMGHFLNG